MLLSLMPFEHGHAFHCSLRNFVLTLLDVQSLQLVLNLSSRDFVCPMLSLFERPLILRSQEAEFSCFPRSIPLIISAILRRFPILWYHKSRYVKHVDQKLKFTRGACGGISDFLVWRSCSVVLVKPFKLHSNSFVWIEGFESYYQSREKGNEGTCQVKTLW